MRSRFLTVFFMLLSSATYAETSALPTITVAGICDYVLAGSSRDQQRVSLTPGQITRFIPQGIAENAEFLISLGEGVPFKTHAGVVAGHDYLLRIIRVESQFPTASGKAVPKFADKSNVAEVLIQVPIHSGTIGLISPPPRQERRPYVMRAEDSNLRLRYTLRYGFLDVRPVTISMSLWIDKAESVAPASAQATTVIPTATPKSYLVRLDLPRASINDPGPSYYARVVQHLQTAGFEVRFVPESFTELIVTGIGDPSTAQGGHPWISSVDELAANGAQIPLTLPSSSPGKKSYYVKLDRSQVEAQARGPVSVAELIAFLAAEGFQVFPIEGIATEFVVVGSKDPRSLQVRQQAGITWVRELPVY